MASIITLLCLVLGIYQANGFTQLSLKNKLEDLGRVSKLLEDKDIVGRQGTVPELPTTDVNGTNGGIKIDTANSKLVTLDNGITVLAISENVSVATIALAVDVGIVNDPKGYGGMAHMIEHMVALEFDGSNSILSDQAYTTPTSTVYQYRARPQQFLKDIQEFASRFDNQKIQSSFYATEVINVDSEFRVRQYAEGRRISQLIRYTANPKHPYQRSSAGSLETLRNGRTLAEATAVAQQFYDDYYRPDLFSLVIIGPLSTNSLIKVVDKTFGRIPARRGPSPVIKEKVVTEKEKGKLVKYLPFTTESTIAFVWDVESSIEQYPLFTNGLIADYVDSELKGSATAQLIKEGLAFSMQSTSVGDDISKRDQVTWLIPLTKKGDANIERVVEIVFEQIEVMKSMTSAQWKSRFQQQVAISKVFNEQNPLPRTALAESAAQYLQRLGSKEVFNFIEDKPQKFSFESISKVLDYFTIDDVRIFWGSPSHSKSKLTKVEPAYKQQFSIEDLPGFIVKAAGKASAGNDLSVPAKIRYLPKRFKSKRQKLSDTEQIKSGKFYEVWQQTTPAYKQSAAMQFQIRTPALKGSAINYMYGNIFTRYIELSIGSLLYEAGLSATNWDIFVSGTGTVDVTVSGSWTEIPKLHALITDAASNLDFEDEGMYETALNYVQDVYENYKRQALTSVYASVITDLLYKDAAAPTIEEIVAVIKKASFSGFISFLKSDLFSSFYVTAVAVGPLSPANAVKMTEQVVSMVQSVGDSEGKAAKEGPVDVKTTSLPTNPDYYYELDVPQEDSLTAVVVQGLNDGETKVTTAAMLVFRTIVRSVFFNIIRTDQQLGYVATIRSFDQDNVPQLAFIVQGVNKDSRTVSAQIDEFIDALAVAVGTTDPELIEGAAEEVAYSIFDVGPDALATRRLRDISDGPDALLRDLRLVATLLQASGEVLQEAMLEALLGEKSRRLDIRLTGTQDKGKGSADGKAVKDIRKWKKQLGVVE